MLRDLVSFVQFKKREKHQWWSVIFSKVTGSKLSRNASDMLLNPDIVEDIFRMFLPLSLPPLAGIMK